MLSLIERASGFGGGTAVVDGNGAHTYADLLYASSRKSALLLAQRDDLEGARVAFMVTPGFDYVAWQWAIWLSGGIAVPIALTHPTPEISYLFDDARPQMVVADREFEPVLRSLVSERSLRLIESTEDGGDGPNLPDLHPDRSAMMLYTSGTTGRPKGVVISHAAIEAQIRSLTAAWEWSVTDRILLVLPLHHIHGVVNVVACALWSGATCEMLPRFDAEECWRRLGSGELTLFMAVPTIYHRLIAAWERLPRAESQRLTEGCGALRLMVSGSAALPVTVLERWREISGHTLLERYGMTEIGMGLSNPLHGERRPGRVGSPLPGVEVRLVDDSQQPVPDGEAGEIQVRGPMLFSEYWGRPDATAEAFVDGWFRTGDVATREEGAYRILGRDSVDIIKSGGEKVSALEVEEVLLRHESVADAAVVGVPDDEWGQKVVAAVVMASPTDPDELRSWLRDRLAPYKAPKEIRFVESLPRNAMGKVTKPEIARLLTG